MHETFRKDIDLQTCSQLELAGYVASDCDLQNKIWKTARRYLRNHERDEFFSDVYLRLLSSSSKIRVGLEQFLFYLARSCAVDLIRKKIRNRIVVEDYANFQSTKPLTDEDVALRVHQAVSQLTQDDPIMGKCVRLRLYESTYGEIAIELGLSVRQVRTRFEVGLKMLRQYLENPV